LRYLSLSPGFLDLGNPFPFSSTAAVWYPPYTIPFRLSRVEERDYLKMPRRSERANALGELKNEIKHRMADADMRFILDEEDELEDELDDMLLGEHSKLSSQRFLEHGEYRNEPTKWEK
jgi:hypothetical protein